MPDGARPGARRPRREEAGHSGHTGPVFSPDLPPGTGWGDVIPAFDFGPGAQSPGMNTDAAGQAVLDAGCAVAGPTTTPPQ